MEKKLSVNEVFMQTTDIIKWFILSISTPFISRTMWDNGMCSTLFIIPVSKHDYKLHVLTYGGDAFDGEAKSSRGTHTNTRWHVNTHVYTPKPRAHNPHVLLTMFQLDIDI